MESINLFISKLKPLGLYNLNQGTLIYAELASYAVALDVIYDKLEEIEKEMFVDTAESYGLTLREKAFGYKRSNVSMAVRREMLNYRSSITSNNFNKEKIKDALVASGIDGYIIEVPSEYLMHINCLNVIDTEVSNEEAESRAKKFMPAHVETIFDFRPLQWSYIDNMDLTFEEMDSNDLTWNEIDNYM